MVVFSARRRHILRSPHKYGRFFTCPIFRCLLGRVVRDSKASQTRKYHENSGRAAPLNRPDRVSRMNDEVRADLEPIAADPAPRIAIPQTTAVAAASTVQPPHWLFALMQSIAVCGIPTQVVVAAGLILVAGMTPLSNEGLSLEFIATVSFLDTALVAVLIRVFLVLSGETSRDVYLGRRPVLGEIGRGLALVPVTFLLVVGLVSAVRAIAPWLHNVKVSPLEALDRKSVV